MAKPHASTPPPAGQRPQRVLVLSYHAYPTALIQAYTLPYVQQLAQALPPGGHVWLRTMEGPTTADLAAENAQLAAHGITWVPGRYLPPSPLLPLQLLGQLLGLVRLVRRQRIDVIHTWCTPAGALGWLLSLLTGRPLVLDSFEPHADAMVENGTWRAGGLKHRLLLWLERRQVRRARAVVACVGAMQQYAQRRLQWTPPASQPWFTKPACVDLQRFAPQPADENLRQQLGLQGKLVLGYAGKFGGIYHDVAVFAFLKAASDHYGADRLRALILSTDPPERLHALARQAGLPAQVLVHRAVPHHQVPRYLALMDVALSPVKPVPSKRYCTPIKDGEYWAMGLPVVLPTGISDDAELIEATGAGLVVPDFAPAHTPSLLQRLDDLLQPQRLAHARTQARQLAETHRSFAHAQAVYDALYGPGGVLAPSPTKP